MLQFKNEDNMWAYGVILSFDFNTKLLKEYFSITSPQGAYRVMKYFLLSHGFEHKKDSDYVNIKIHKVKAVDLLLDFAENNAWFPICVNKMNISPNIISLDISTQLQRLVNI